MILIHVVFLAWEFLKNVFLHFIPYCKIYSCYYTSLRLFWQLHNVPLKIHDDFRFLLLKIVIPRISLHVSYRICVTMELLGHGVINIQLETINFPKYTSNWYSCQQCIRKQHLPVMCVKKILLCFLCNSLIINNAEHISSHVTWL